MADFIGGHMIDIPDIPSAQDFIDIVKDLEAAAAGGADYFSSVEIGGETYRSVTLSSEEKDIVLNFPQGALSQDDIEDKAEAVQTLWEDSDSDIMAHATMGPGPSDQVDNNGEKARPDFGPYTERMVLPPSQNENFYFKDALENGKTPPFLKGEQPIEGARTVNADLASRTPGIFQRHGFDQLKGDMFSMTAAKNGLTAENSLVSIESGVQDKGAVDDMKEKFDTNTLRIDRLSGMEGYVPALKDGSGNAVRDKGGRPIQGVSLYIISACERSSGERIYERAYVSPNGTVLGTDDPNKSIFRIFPGDRLEIADRTSALVGNGRPFHDKDSFDKAIGASVGEYTDKLRHEVGSKVEAAYKEKGDMEALRDKLSGFISMAKTVRVLEMSDKVSIYGENVSLTDLYKKLDASYDRGEAFADKVRAGDKSELSDEDKGLLKDIFTYINLSAEPVIYNGKVRDGSEVLDKMTGDIKENISHEDLFSKIDLVGHKIDDLCRVDAETRVELEPARAAYATIMDSFGNGMFSENDVFEQTADYIKSRVDDYNADKDKEHKLHIVTDDNGCVKVYTYGGDLVQPDRPSADFYDEAEDYREDKSESRHDERIDLLNDAYDNFFQGAPDISLYVRSVIGRVIPYPSVINGIFRVKTGETRADYLSSDQKEELREKIRDYINDQYGISADDKVVDEIMQTPNHPVVREYMDALEDKPVDIERLEGLSYESLNITDDKDPDKDKILADLDLPASSDKQTVDDRQRMADLPKSHGRYGRVNYARDVALSDRCQYDLKVAATKEAASPASNEFISAKEELQAERDSIRKEAIESIAEDYRDKAEGIYKADQAKYDSETALRTETYYVRHQDDLNKDFEDKAKAGGGDVESYKEAWRKAAFESFKEDRIKEIATDLAKDDDKALREEAKQIAADDDTYKESVKTPELEAEARAEAKQWVQDNKNELTEEVRNELSGRDTAGDPFEEKARQELPDADKEAILDRADQLRVQDGLDKKEDAKYKEILDEKVQEKATDKAASDLYEKKIDERTDQIIDKKATEKAVDKRLDSLTKEKKAELNRYKQAIMAIDKRLERYEGWPYRALIKNGNYNYNVYVKTVLIKGYLEAGGRDDEKFFKDHIGDPNVDPKARSFLDKGVSRFETAAAWKSAFIESRFFDTAFSEAMYNYSEKHPYEYKLEHGSEIGFERLNSYRESKDFKKAFSYVPALNTIKLLGADAICIGIGLAIGGNPLVGVLAATLMSRGIVTAGRLISVKDMERKVNDFIKNHRVDEISGKPISNDDKTDRPDNDKPDKGDKDDAAADDGPDDVSKENASENAVAGEDGAKDQADADDSGAPVLSEEQDEDGPVTEEHDNDPLTSEEEEEDKAADDEERSEDPVAAEEEAEARVEDDRAKEEDKAAEDDRDKADASKKDDTDKPEKDRTDRPEDDKTDHEDDRVEDEDKADAPVSDPEEDGPVIRDDTDDGVVDMAMDAASDQAAEDAATGDTTDEVENQEGAPVDGGEGEQVVQDEDDGQPPVSSDSDEDDQVTVPESEGSGDSVVREGAALKENQTDREDGDDESDAMVLSSEGDDTDAQEEGKQEVERAPEPEPENVDVHEEQAIDAPSDDNGCDHSDEDQERPAAEESPAEEAPIINDDEAGENVMDRLQMALDGKEEMDHVINGSGDLEGLSAAAEDASFDIAAFARDAGEMVGEAAMSPDTYENAVSAAAHIEDFLSRFDTEDNSPSDTFREAVKDSISNDQGPVTTDAFEEDVSKALDSMTERIAQVGSIAGVEFEADTDGPDLKDITADSISHTVTNDEDMDAASPMDTIMDFAKTAMEALQDLGQSFGEIIQDCLNDLLNMDALADPVTVEQLEPQQQGLDLGTEANEKFETPLKYDKQEQLIQDMVDTPSMESNTDTTDEMIRLQNEMDAESMAEAIIASL